MITAIVDILPTSGAVTRVRITGRTARAVENGIDQLDRTLDGDDIALVSVTGSKPQSIGFNDEPYEWWYAGPLAPVTVEVVSLDETEPLPFSGLVASLRVVCSNTLAFMR